MKTYPEILSLNINPLIHYISTAKNENSFFSCTELSKYNNYKTDCDTILVVCHDASRAGAPILALNIVQNLACRYCVVALLLGDGPLVDEFRLAGAILMTSNIRGFPSMAFGTVDRLCKHFSFKFALVNSVESSSVLPALVHNGVPTISLFHEFAAYTRPRGVFRESLLLSDEIVFSTKMTMDNAFDEYPEIHLNSVHIFPQGKCVVPVNKLNNEQLQLEQERIRSLIRTNNVHDESVIILGAGSIIIRKGIDLFIECAARVTSTSLGKKCRFMWIGKGYDPENDITCSVYLADQIRRAGLQEYVFFIDETPAIETAYEEADLLLLSSRLDPLPNVAIDGMFHGLPVLCFNQATGIADFLTEYGLNNYCVAEYLDTYEMAQKILALAASKDLREYVGNKCREASISYFNMKRYVANLEVLAKSVCDYKQREKEDIQIILSSNLFRLDFVLFPSEKDKPIESAVLEYVLSWHKKLSRRKPFPGFHPGIYSEQHGLSPNDADPFADYLKAGRPDGPWNYQVIVPGKTIRENLPNSQMVALHVHVYYPELLPELMTRLSRNILCPDLFISVTDEEARHLVINELKKYKGKVVDIKIVENRGRDIGPFFTVFGKKIMDNYEFTGHLHTKKTTDVKNANIGKIWYNFLLENLIGCESYAMTDRILAEMKNNSSIGMVFPDDPYIVGWDSNREFAEPIAKKMGIVMLPENFIFPVGTMFWARTAALKPLLDLNSQWNNYPEEPIPYDGTLLHAIERLFSLVLQLNTYRCVTTNVPGIIR